MGLLSAADFDNAALMCARLFAFGQGEAARRGLILVDTKYEIGRRPDGELCFIDEIHTPDSSRYWYADDYQARFDRAARSRAASTRSTCAARWPSRATGATARRPRSPTTCASRRRAATSRSASSSPGRPFVPDTDEPIARIRRNLARSGPV